MRDAIGGSMLLNLVIIFSGVIIVLFIGVLSYSKAYRVKNRIVEIIEKYETYEYKQDGVNLVTQELNSDLMNAGYDSSNPTECDNIRNRLVSGTNARYSNNELGDNLNSYGYNYCVYEVCDQKDNNGLCNDLDGNYYVVVSFVRFEFPVIGDILTFPVYSETKILGKNYNY